MTIISTHYFLFDFSEWLCKIKLNRNSLKSVMGGKDHFAPLLVERPCAIFLFMVVLKGALFYDCFVVALDNLLPGLCLLRTESDSKRLEIRGGSCIISEALERCSSLFPFLLVWWLIETRDTIGC